MGTYTGDSLDKLRKQDLMPIALPWKANWKIKTINAALYLQSKLEDKNNTVLEEVSKFNESFSKLYAEVVITKMLITCC